jgi:hypothetical protein
MIIRSFEPHEYEYISTWFKVRWGDAAPPLSALPTTGWVAEVDGAPSAAIWLYISNSTVGFMEWAVTNPDMPPVSAVRALKALVEFVQEQATLLEPPVDVILQFVVDEKLAGFYEKRLGFQNDGRATLMRWSRKQGE